MGRGYRIFVTIEFVFVATVVGAFIAMAIVGLLFGFEISQWNEWTQVVVGMTTTLGAMLGGVLGIYLALGEIHRG